MRRTLLLSISLFVCACGSVWGDTFGTGANQFTIEFVTISGATNPTSGYGIVENDYRMGVYEITNAQFAKFASNSNVYWTGADIPCNRVSWFEAAQFVNWLNTSSGHQAAYRFNGSTFSVWNVTDTGYDASNPYRNSNAYYFLPTEHEWVKAAYWNGTNLQTYATKAGENLYQGNGSNGGWNYYYTTGQPWNVGSGSEELNGTFDMMGNVWEWMENSHYSGNYLSDSPRSLRGGSYSFYGGDLRSYNRLNGTPDIEYIFIGFRVASVPEPCSVMLLGLGTIALRLRRN